MATKPLPPTRDDPALQAGYAAQSAYVEQLQEIRFDHTRTDLDKAEAVMAAYEALQAELQRLGQDLSARRAARHEELIKPFPFGPGIAEGTSPADRAVLAASFRAELDKARNAKLDERRAMLADALRFDDDTVIRAVFTVANENGEMRLMDMWAAHTGNTAVVEEARHLNQMLQGFSRADRAWELQAFTMPHRPEESYALPGLRQAAERAEQDMNRQRALQHRLRTRPS